MKVPISGEEVMIVCVRERILAIRLMEKVNAHPAYAEKLGIVVNKPADSKAKIPLDSAGNKL